MATLRNTIIEKMSDKKFNVKTLSEKSGVSKTVIYGLLKGNYYQPYFTTIIKIFKVLEVTDDEMYRIII